ncbi:MAG: hypothetical protein K6C34_04225 [Alphaproteobacteria bacterium]|nr:hypothetical protein [Alphaproteobacteria bacterium]
MKKVIYAVLALGLALDVYATKSETSDSAQSAALELPRVDSRRAPTFEDELNAVLKIYGTRDSTSLPRNPGSVKQAIGDARKALWPSKKQEQLAEAVVPEKDTTITENDIAITEDAANHVVKSTVIRAFATPVKKISAKNQKSLLNAAKQLADALQDLTKEAKTKDLLDGSTATSSTNAGIKVFCDQLENIDILKQEQISGSNVPVIDLTPKAASNVDTKPLSNMKKSGQAVKEVQEAVDRVTEILNKQGIAPINLDYISGDQLPKTIQTLVNGVKSFLRICFNGGE